MYFRVVYIVFLFSGESGIRTRDTLLAYTRFPGVPLQPLEHHSKILRIFICGAKILFFLILQTICHKDSNRILSIYVF